MPLRQPKGAGMETRYGVKDHLGKIHYLPTRYGTAEALGTQSYMPKRVSAVPRAERGKAHAAPEGGRGAEQGGAGALLRELVVGPHHVIAAVLAKVVLVRTVLPQLVVQLFGVYCTYLLLLCL